MLSKEVETAWRLWQLMNDFNNVLWDRYQEEFEEIDEAEQNQRIAIRSDAQSLDDYSF